MHDEENSERSDPHLARRDDSALLRRLDASSARVCREQRHLLRLIDEADQRELWRDDGAHDMAHWLGMRYGISDWKARRWIAAAHALEALPRVSSAFASGELGIDKVVELTRFATPDDEDRLVVWARGVSSGCIRRKADVLARRFVKEAEASSTTGSSRGGTSTKERASGSRPSSLPPTVP